MEFSKEKKYPRNNVFQVLKNIKLLSEFSIISKDEEQKLINFMQTALAADDYSTINKEFVDIYSRSVCLKDTILECINLTKISEEDI